MTSSAHSPFTSPKRWLSFVCAGGLACVLLAAIPVTPEEASGSPSGHWSSVLPPLLAILLAIFFQQLFVSLGSSVVLGAFLAYGPLPWVALPQGFETFIWANLKSGFNLYILAFTFTLLGMVHVMHHSGAAWGLVTLLFGAAKSAR